jgi:tetratricopeptide (TPR) repeat protein
VKHIRLFIPLSLALLMMGCSAVSTNIKDPQKKLIDAKDLFDYQDSPIQAERLINEAVHTFRKTKDDVGLADAYRLYGFFFQSEAVDRWERTYRKQGFLDKSATFEGRKSKAMEYFEEARALYLSHQAYDQLTNVDLNMGFAYERNLQRLEACKAFDRALEDYMNNTQAHPAAKEPVPSGFKTWPDFFEEQKMRAKCGPKGGNAHE